MVTPECAVAWTEKTVAKPLEEKLSDVGIKAILIEIEKTSNDALQAIVKIEPIDKKKIEEAMFPLRVSGLKLVIV